MKINYDLLRILVANPVCLCPARQCYAFWGEFIIFGVFEVCWCRAWGVHVAVLGDVGAP